MSTLTSPNLTKICRGHILSFVDLKWNDPISLLKNTPIGVSESTGLDWTREKRNRATVVTNNGNEQAIVEELHGRVKLTEKTWQLL